jgi:drug/metabolite transporter (DMT)-like permease
MKTASDWIRGFCAMVVSTVVVMAIYVALVFGVMSLIKYVLPFAGIAGVLVMVVGTSLIADYLWNVAGEKMGDVVFTIVFFMFGVDYHMWDADDVKTVKPETKAAEGPEPQAT